MPSVTINLTRLHAAAQCASHEVTRYYLNGVHLECTASHIVYVATDGHALFAYQEEISGVRDDPFIGNLIIPNETIKAAKITGKARAFPAATLKVDGTRCELELPYQGGIVFTPVDGTFPDWRRVVPWNVASQGESGFQIDPRILVKLWKAGDLIDSPYPTLAMNGGAPALVRFDDENAFGVVMPRRCGPTGPDVKAPFWVHNTGPAPVAKAA